MEPQGDAASSAQASDRAAPNNIQHMPRKKATAPGFGNLQLNLEPEHVTRSSPPSPEGRVIEIRERRWGPLFVKITCYSGAAAVGWTYINGFMHLYKKNRAGWQKTFQHRLYILSPLMAMYACGNGVIPMPFKRHIEGLLGRPALSTMDIYNAKETLARKAAAGSS